MHTWLKPSRVLSNACELDSQPSASTSKPGVFRLGALHLLMHADVCAEIVFVVVDGHNGSWRVIEQESVNRGIGCRRIANAELCQKHLAWQQIGFAGTMFRGQSAVQVQRVWCSILRTRDEREDTAQHFAKTKVFGSIASCLHHMEDTPTIICCVTSQAPPPHTLIWHQ